MTRGPAIWPTMVASTPKCASAGHERAGRALVGALRARRGRRRRLQHAPVGEHVLALARAGRRRAVLCSSVASSATSSSGGGSTTPRRRRPGSRARRRRAAREARARAAARRPGPASAAAPAASARRTAWRSGGGRRRRTRRRAGARPRGARSARRAPRRSRRAASRARRRAPRRPRRRARAERDQQADERDREPGAEGRTSSRALRMTISPPTTTSASGATYAAQPISAQPRLRPLPDDAALPAEIEDEARKRPTARAPSPMSSGCSWLRGRASSASSAS